jgi:hypothetical protein
MRCVLLLLKSYSTRKSQLYKKSAHFAREEETPFAVTRLSSHARGVGRELESRAEHPFGVGCNPKPVTRHSQLQILDLIKPRKALGSQALRGPGLEGLRVHPLNTRGGELQTFHDFHLRNQIAMLVTPRASVISIGSQR